MSPDHRHDRQCFSLTAACLGLGLFSSLVCAAGPACAQTSGSLSLVSEYAVRGISLSGGRPALQLRIDHDMADGWYAGGFASPVKLVDDGRQAGLVVYGGRAGSLPSGLSWDAGLSRAVFLSSHEYDYTEFHAGIALDQASASLFVSPAYYGSKPSAYLDLNAFHPLGDRLRLTFHAGLLHRFGAYGGPRDRADLRLGLAATFGDCTVQLGWQTLLRAGGNIPRARALSGSVGIRF